MDIKVARLVTGEMVVAEVLGGSAIERVSESLADLMREEVVFKNPCAIGITPDGHATMGPLSPFSRSDKIKIRRSHILFMDEPEMGVRNAYAEQHGGLTIAKPGLNLDG